MSPRFPRNNFPYSRMPDAEHCREPFVIALPAGVKCSEFKNLPVCQFASCALFAPPVGCSALANHVPSIIDVRSCPQMNRITARPAIDAGMKNAHIGRNGASVNCDPRETMRSKMILPAREAQSHLPVTTISQACSPKPTLIQSTNSYLRPKSGLEFVREYLRQQFRGDRICSHKSDSLICATSPDANRGDIFIMN